MPSEYPVPIFHFDVQWGGIRISFSEVSGLTQENQSVEYRDGSLADSSAIKMPGLCKSGKIRLERGTVRNGSDFSKWLSDAQLNRHDITISRLNGNHEPVMTWVVRDALPVKVEGPQLKASGNEVAIESIEIAHEGVELQEDKSPKKPSGSPIRKG